MNGLQMMLKGFGIKVDDATLRQIEAILPVLPAKINELIQFVNQRVDEFDGRLSRIEQSLIDLRYQLEEKKHDSKRGHAGAHSNGGGS